MANENEKKARQVIEEKRKRGEGHEPTTEEPDPTEPGRPQDTLDPRAKNAGTGGAGLRSRPDRRS
jgi:hypothetical protein